MVGGRGQGEGERAGRERAGGNRVSDCPDSGLNDTLPF